MKYSVCIDSIFRGKSISDAIKATKEAGLDTFEFWGWWEKDIDEIVHLQKEYDVKVSAFCTKFIGLTDSHKHEEYKKGLIETIKVAKVLGCDRIITIVGDKLQDISQRTQHNNIVEGLKSCIPMLKEAGVTLMIEPLNTVKDHKEYYLGDVQEAFDIIDEVGSPYVKVLYDIYHQEMMNDNDLDRMISNIDKIAHFHAAGFPGRHELDSGDTNYKKIIDAIESSSYDGYIGLEYFPIKDAVLGLKEIAGNIK